MFPKTIDSFFEIVYNSIWVINEIKATDFKRNGVSMKKALAVFLSVLFLLALGASPLPEAPRIHAGLTAQAADAPTVNGWRLLVNGEYITDGRLTVLCGAGAAEFDPETNTLTLNNAELTVADDPDATFEKAYGNVTAADARLILRTSVGLETLK